eukprot:TRINITY_DN10380_c0_g2_i5.p1 TRINITY_DN10380_c0_g2~~TRINITY_DN10380_c0_g2_i5.p1  ORF type:complete len:226 (+),score=28.36 TRINITY_DN10380_c0_g2_i5:28-678(+)
MGGCVLLLLCLLSGTLGAPTFNEQTSYRFLYYAYAAYNLPPAGTWNCPYCINGTKGFVNTVNCNNISSGAFAYGGYNPNYNEIVMSFRGSSDIQNWIEDLYAIKTPPGQAFPGLPDAQVEGGFYYYYESLKSCIIGEIKTLRSKYPSYNVILTGHSLGAAGAAMCAMDLIVNMGYKGVECYNFGEPRLGNPAYYSASLQYLSGLQRMVDYDDCVPK